MSESPSDAEGVPWHSRTVQVVLASTALAPLGVPLVSPALPVFREFFGRSDAQISLLVSGYFLVGILLSPFIGLLADRVGRKRVLVAGLFAFGAFGTAMAFAPSFEVVLALRVLQGTAAAAIFITTVTVIGDTFEGTRRTTVLGVNVAVLSAGAALYPLVGGALVTLAWNAPFLAYAAALPVALFAALTLGEPERPAASRGTAYLREALDAVATPGTLALFAATFLTEFLAFGVVFTAVPFLLAAALGPVAIGALLLAGETAAMVAAAATGRLARWVSDERLVAIGFACFGLGFAAAWALPRSLAVGAALAVAGVGLGLLLPSVDATLSKRVPAEYRAGAFSLRNSTTFSGRAAGPITFAALATATGVGYDPLILAAGILALFAAALAFLATRTG